MSSFDTRLLGHESGIAPTVTLGRFHVTVYVSLMRHSTLNTTGQAQPSTRFRILFDCGKESTLESTHAFGAPAFHRAVIRASRCFTSLWLG